MSEEVMGYSSKIDDLIDRFKNSKMCWDDFLFFTNSSLSSESVQAPRRENVYNEPSVSFYKDGSVWVSGSKGSVVIFKKCSYLLMFEMFLQRYREVNND